MISRTRRFGAVLGSALVLVVGGARSAVPAQATRPNIVLIFPDNLGWGEVGVYGSVRGVGVIALPPPGPVDIPAEVPRLGLDPSRLWIGVGAGFAKKPLTAMREALPALREALPGTRLVLAAMGPKMCALAGSSYDGAFFNWMTPEYAAGAREHVERGAREAGREPPPVFGYVRTAVGPESEARLAKEEAFYRDLHKGYRDHFDRLGAPEGTVGVAADNPGETQTELTRYRALDTIVVRGLASATVEDMGIIAESAAPGV